MLGGNVVGSAPVYEGDMPTFEGMFNRAYLAQKLLSPAVNVYGYMKASEGRFYPSGT
jgi:hypothetical protein